MIPSHYINTEHKTTNIPIVPLGWMTAVILPITDLLETWTTPFASKPKSSIRMITGPSNYNAEKIMCLDRTMACQKLFLRVFTKKEDPSHEAQEIQQGCRNRRRETHRLQGSVLKGTIQPTKNCQVI